MRAACIYNDSRASKEIKALLDAGYRVCILNWNRDGRDIGETERVLAGHGSYEQHCFCEDAQNGIGMRNLPMLVRWIRWVKKSLREYGDFDAVHACNLDAGIGVLSYVKKSGCKLIYDIYDYYIDSHSIPLLIEGTIESLEIELINRADATVICTEERKEQIAKATPSQVVVVHNSPQVDSIPNVPVLYDYVYCGALNGGRLLNEIFDKYPQNCGFTICVAGFGRLAARASQLAKDYRSFEYRGSVPYEDVLRIESSARVLSAIYEPSKRNHRLCAPNKFYEALALGRPLIVCRGTGIDKVVEANQIGRVIEKYDADDFYTALESILCDSKEAAAMGARARVLYESSFSWTKSEQKLVHIYASLME